MRTMARLDRALALSFFLLSGCYLSHERDASDAGVRDARVDVPPADGGFDAPFDGGWDAPFDGGVDAPMDAGVDGWVEMECDAGPEPEDAGVVDVRVDLLFVVDSSGSMTEEQAALARELPRLLRVLVTGDADEDGTRDFDPVTSLRAGVVTTEVDVGRRIEGCGVSPFSGDDGILRAQGNVTRLGCETAYPTFLEFEPGSGDDPGAFVRDITCVAVVGIAGCHFEQPLEAALKAVTPSTSDIAFVVGTGRADRDNAAFFREDALLMVLLITDEDDCSIADPELTNPRSTTYPPSTERGGLQCTDHPEALFPIARYVDGLRATRDPSSLFLAAIAGVPPDRVRDPSRIDYDALLRDPRMTVRADPDDPDRLVPVCETEGTGSAEPSRRLVELVRDLGPNATIQSICDAPYTRGLSVIISELGRVIRRRRCL
jgi:hypothetical protein